MPKQKKYICYLTITVLLGLVWIINLENKSIADPLSVIEEASGGILPAIDTDLQMIEAKVVMYIDETHGENGSFAISFDGNYTIYNPYETIEILIGAPFLTIYEGLTDTLKIEVEGLEKQYDIIYCYLKMRVKNG